MALSTLKGSSARDYLYLVDEYSKHASSRKGAFQRVSEVSGIPVSTLRVAAYREGRKDDDRSLKFAFSVEEEKALVAACILHAHQGIPLRLKAFIELASTYAKKEDGRKFSYRFANDFIRRNGIKLCRKRGKRTSPTRSVEAMLQMTKDFVALIETYIKGNVMNKQNIVAFDEAKIGDNPTLPLYIGENKESGGGNINVIETFEAPLGCYIPFSMPDGTTPFRVFIFKNEKIKSGVVPLSAVTQLTRLASESIPIGFIFRERLVSLMQNSLLILWKSSPTSGTPLGQVYSAS